MRCTHYYVPRKTSFVLKGWITQEGWFCFWTYTTLFDYATTLEYLAYFGYPINDYENQCSAVQSKIASFCLSPSSSNICEKFVLDSFSLVTRDKKSDLLKKQSLRNAYVCHVIGEKGSGKSTLCKTHIGRSLKVNSIQRTISFDIDIHNGVYFFFHIIIERIYGLSYKSTSARNDEYSSCILSRKVFSLKKYRYKKHRRTLNAE